MQIYPMRNEVHRATEAHFGSFNKGYITRPMGHFIEQEKGGSGVSWLPGAPVEWYTDPERGENYPQVILPDGHMFTCFEDDIIVIGKRKYDERMARINDFIKRKES